jgi:hypothetical protein
VRGLSYLVPETFRPRNVQKGVTECAGDLFASTVEEKRADQVAPCSPRGENT